MSAYHFTIKQDDLRPSLKAQLLSNRGEALDLSQAVSVTFSMKRRVGNSVKIEKRPCTTEIDDDGVESIAVYAWDGSDTDTVGIYQGEFEVLWTNNIPQTFPDDQFITVEVIKDIA